MAKAIDRAEDEVRGEPEVLRKFAKTPLPKAAPGSIFVGAGDSYAAALEGFYASEAECLALDPYALSSAPQMAKGREIFFISVSGRTSSNVEAARKVRGIASRTTAITAVSGSLLSSLASRTIVLPMTYLPKTPGMLSFSLSLLAVLKTVMDDFTDPGFGDIYASAARRGRIEFGKGTTYFLGNSLAYPIAIYAAAKTYELLGRRAHAELLEEFSHMQLFSLARSDAVNVFSSFDPLGMIGKLVRALSEQKYKVNTISVVGPSFAAQLFHSVFLTQLSVLREARKMGLKEPRFLTPRGRLRISDSMIY